MQEKKITLEITQLEERIAPNHIPGLAAGLEEASQATGTIAEAEPGFAVICQIGPILDPGFSC
ncbi:MAG: hypothetical protein ACE5MH_07605 [Terriglobia bacterium]